MERKLPTSYRLSADARRLLAVLAAHFGISHTAALEIIIRLVAEQKGLQ